MVAGYVSKDSCSRYEAPSVLYGTLPALNRSPQPSNPAVKSIGNVKDTMESAQQRLKREMFNRFHNKGLELPHESYVAVVQVGKYVFLAVMLPVYLTFYSIPKWFLVHAIAQSLALIHQFYRVGRLARKMAKQVTDLMKGMLEQLIGDALCFVKDRARNTLKFFALKFAHGMQRRTHLVKKITLTIEKLKQMLAQGSGRLYGKAEHHVHVANHWMLKRASVLFKQALGSSLRALKVFDRFAFTPLIELMIPAFNLFVSTGQRIKMRIVETFKKIKSELRVKVNPIILMIHEAIKKMAKRFQKSCGRLLEPVGILLLDMQNVVEVYFKKMKKAVLSPSVKRLNALKINLKSFAAANLSLAQKTLSTALSLFSGLLRFAWGVVPQSVKEKLNKRKQFFSQCKKHLKQAFKIVISVAAQGVRCAVKYAKELKGLLIRFAKLVFEWLLKNLLEFPGKLKRTCLSGLKKIVFTVGKVIFFFEVMIVLIGISCFYGFKLVKEISGSLLEKTP